MPPGQRLEALGQVRRPARVVRVQPGPLAQPRRGQVAEAERAADQHERHRPPVAATPRACAASRASSDRATPAGPASGAGRAGPARAARVRAAAAAGGGTGPGGRRPPRCRRSQSPGCSCSARPRTSRPGCGPGPGARRRAPRPRPGPPRPAWPARSRRAAPGPAATRGPGSRAGWRARRGPAGGDHRLGRPPPRTRPQQHGRGAAGALLSEPWPNPAQAARPPSRTAAPSATGVPARTHRQVCRVPLDQAGQAGGDREEQAAWTPSRRRPAGAR